MLQIRLLAAPSREYLGRVFYPLGRKEIFAAGGILRRQGSFWNGNGQDDLVLGLPALGDGADAGHLDPGQRLVQVV